MFTRIMITAIARFHAVRYALNEEKIMACEDPAEKAPADTPPNSTVSARAVLKILAVILAVMAALWLLYRLGTILLLLILSIFLAISSRRWSRVWSGR